MAVTMADKRRAFTNFAPTSIDFLTDPFFQVGAKQVSQRPAPLSQAHSGYPNRSR